MERSKISFNFTRIARKLYEIAAIPMAVSIKLKRRKSSRLYSCEEDEKMWRTPVPLGHVPVYASEKERRRFVIPVSYLNHPVFGELLRKAEDEFGYYYHNGGVTIPCEPSLLDSIIEMLKDCSTTPERQQSEKHGDSSFSHHNGFV